MELTSIPIMGFLEDPADILVFLGRFHPLVVHLPIGFLILAVLLHFIGHRTKFQPLVPFVHYLWGLGALSALFAVFLGYLLSLSGDYDEDILFWHKWSGVAVFLLSLACYFLFKPSRKKTRMLQWPLVLLAALAMMYTGHLGGSLTHGQTYLLEYAPNPIRDMAGLPPKKAARPKVIHLDSADIYLDLVQPMLDSKCTSCHNPGKKKGGLLLTSYTALMQGGENGEVIAIGDVNASELFRRVTLPENHDDFMPSEGKRPLTEEEVDIIGFWIAAGAPPQGYLTKLDSKNEITETVTTYLGLDKNLMLEQTVGAPDPARIDSLTDNGFIINRLMRDNYFLDADFGLSEKKITPSDLDLLIGLREQLVWLDLNNSGVTDEHLPKLGQLTNLIKLDLSGNPISDQGIRHLSRLVHLESLNLYNTQVSEGLLSLLPHLDRLQRIYLWKTSISDTLARQLQGVNKNLRVIYKRDSIP